MLLIWLMLTSYGELEGLCGGGREFKADWKENAFQWTAKVVLTSIGGAQST